MTEEQDKALARLREAFPPESIGKLPRSTKAENPKGRCNECGGWHGLPAVHLDFVGHAAVTDRLLSVDPMWTWEPVAFDERGLPLVAKGANGDLTMWLRLTVCGVTRLGVGSVPNGSFEAEKQLISDGLRNAAMRFGVALDLWAKGELESAHQPETWFGWDSKEMAEAAHDAIAERIKAASEEVRTAANEWRKEHGVEKLWPMAFGIYADFEAFMLPLLAEAPEAPTPPDAPSAAPEPQDAASGEIAPSGATPEPAASEPDRMDACIAFVKAMDKAAVVAHLAGAGAATNGSADARAARLVELLMAEGWEPAQAVMV